MATNQKVGGSNPSGHTIRINLARTCLEVGAFLCDEAELPYSGRFIIKVINYLYNDILKIGKIVLTKIAYGGIIIKLHKNSFYKIISTGKKHKKTKNVLTKFKNKSILIKVAGR